MNPAHVQPWRGTPRGPRPRPMLGHFLRGHVLPTPPKCSAHTKAAGRPRLLIVLDGLWPRPLKTPMRNADARGHSFLTGVTGPFYSGARFRRPVRGSSAYG